MTPKALSREKVCEICSQKFIGNGIKYCSTKCAYLAMDIKLKQRKMKKVKPLFRKGTYRDYKWRIKLFRHKYPHNNPENYIEAIFFQLGYKGYWIFRNKEIWMQWPSQA